VSPDILGVICGYFGAFVLRPITGDYVFSLVLSSAVFLSGAITALFVFIYKMFQTLSGCRLYSFTGIAFILLFSFMFLKSKPADNWYLFEAVCICDIFYFTVTTLLSFSAIAYDLKRTLQGKKYPLDVKTAAAVIPVVYFLGMSVIPPNIPLFLYITLKLIWSGICNRNKQTLLLRCKTNWIYLWYYVVFLFHAYFELFSDRAKTYLNEDGLVSLAEIKEAFWQWKVIFRQFNLFFVGISLLIIALAVICFIVNRAKSRKMKTTGLSRLEMLLIGNTIFGLAVVFATLCYQVITNDTFRSMILLISPFLTLFIFIAFCGIYVCETLPGMFALAPFAMYLLLVPMLSTSLPLTDSAFFWKTTPEQKYEIVNGWIEQTQDAVKSGANEVVLQLPPDSFWNWDQFADTLQKHGIIERYIKVRWE
jgi:hypothetical protein